MSGIIGMLAGIMQMISAITTQLFDSAIVADYISACKLIINFLISIGFIFWCFNLLKLVESGQNLVQHIQALFIGVIYSYSIIPLVQIFYITGMKVASQFGVIQIDSSTLGQDALSKVFSAAGGSVLFFLVILVIVLIEVVKIAMQMMKRFPMILATIPLGALYIVAIFSGEVQQFFTFTKKSGGIMISHIMQVLFLFIGFSLIKDLNLPSFLTGMGFIMFSGKIDSIFGDFMQATQSSGYRQGMNSMLMTSSNILRMVR